MCNSYFIIAVYGFKLKKEHMLHVEHEPIHDLQNRYNVKTGEVTHQEKILIKEGVYKYKFADLEDDDFHYLLTRITDKYNVKTCFNFEDNNLYIGHPIGNFEYQKFIQGFFGEACISEIEALHKKIQESFPKYSKDSKLFILKFKKD